MTCTATLTTATIVPCDHDGLSADFCDCGPYGENVVTFHKLACEDDTPHYGIHESWVNRPTDGLVRWQDGAPGSAPHTPPLVSEDEVTAAYRGWCEELGFAPDSRRALRAALEAAARTRPGGTQ